MTHLRTINESAGIRLLIAAIIGVATGIGAFTSGVGTISLLLGWDAAVIVYVAWIAAIILPLNDKETAHFALREDPSRAGSNLILLLASFASIAAVGSALVEAHTVQGASVFTLTSISIVSVILSWLLIHTIFTLHYARIYYNDRIEGTIDFNQRTKPTYTDFMYVAFTVGMTYQIADTSVSGSALRLTIIRHALLSYVFGTLIVATTVSVIAGLGS